MSLPRQQTSAPGGPLLRNSSSFACPLHRIRAKSSCSRSIHMRMRPSRSASPFCLASLMLLLLLAPPLARARQMPAGQLRQPSPLAEEEAVVAALVEAEAEASSSAPCQEMYVVGEDETLHSISAKCGDPYIMEENPYIADDGDVYPGLVIKITAPLASSQQQAGTGPR